LLKIGYIETPHTGIYICFHIHVPTETLGTGEGETLFFHVVYIMALSVSQIIQCEMVGRLLNNDFETMKKESGRGVIEILAGNLPRMTEEIHEKRQPGYPVFRPRFETSATRLRV
jgi:hypothetical protein